jgi:hypothetical protein
MQAFRMSRMYVTVSAVSYFRTELVLINRSHYTLKQNYTFRSILNLLPGNSTQKVMKSGEVERNEVGLKEKLKEEIEDLKRNHEQALANAMRQVRDTKLRCEEEKMTYGGGAMDGEKEM